MESSLQGTTLNRWHNISYRRKCETIQPTNLNSRLKVDLHPDCFLSFFYAIQDEQDKDPEQEVQLYLSILEYQEKYQETLDFLEGTNCKTYFPGAPISIKIELLKKLGKWVELNQLIKKLLLEE